MAEYLFLIPKSEEGAGAWQQCSIDGKPIKTTDPHAYPNMPLIFATEHVEYASWEEHVENTIKRYRDSD